jgi:hypothetical protein
VVLGHSGCGAVSAAVDVFLEPEKYLSLSTSHALRSILDRLLVVVQASAKKMQETFGTDVTLNPRYREALVEMSVVLNAALAAYTLQQEMGNRGISDLKAAYGVYLLKGNNDPRSGLSRRPVDAHAQVRQGCRDPQRGSCGARRSYRRRSCYRDAAAGHVRLEHPGNLRRQ